MVALVVVSEAASAAAWAAVVAAPKFTSQTFVTPGDIVNVFVLIKHLASLHGWLAGSQGPVPSSR